MFDIKKLQRDTSLERSGVDLKLGDSAFITVARAGGSNTLFAEALREHLAPHRAALEIGALDDEQGARLMAYAYADGCVLGWQGLVDGGVPVPYSKEKARELLASIPDLYNLVREYADKASTFR